MRVQVDGPRIVQDFLKPLIPGVPVRTELPDRWTKGSGPALVVRSGNSDYSGRAWTAETVRVTVFADYLPYARDLISRVDGLLIDRRFVSGVVVSPGVLIAPVKDIQLGCFVAAVEVTVASERKEI